MKLCDTVWIGLFLHWMGFFILAFNALLGPRKRFKQADRQQLFPQKALDVIAWKKIRSIGVLITCQPFFVLLLRQPHWNVELGRKAWLALKNEDVGVHQSFIYSTLWLTLSSWQDHGPLKRDIDTGEVVVRGGKITALKCGESFPSGIKDTRQKMRKLNH